MRLHTGATRRPAALRFLLAGYELTNLENALGPAVGRITMDAR